MNMSTFILVTGIISFILFAITWLLATLLKKKFKIKWHKYFAYLSLTVMAAHATVATYKVMRMYIDF